MATWNSNSTGSSSSLSTRYSLDENDTRPSMLVYKYRTLGGGLEVQSQHDIANTLKKYPRLRITRKSIPRGYSHIEVKREDLYHDNEKEQFKHYPNTKNFLADIALPSAVYWKRFFFNQFPELVIISPESTPENSPANSAEGSKHTTPTNTWGTEEKDVDEEERDASETASAYGKLPYFDFLWARRLGQPT